MQKEEAASECRVWSTAQVSVRDRRSWWIDALSDIIVHVDCEPRRGELFHAELCTDKAGDIRAATYSSVSQTIVRSPRKIARWPAHTVSVGIQIAGRGVATQNGRETALRPGDLVVFDMDRPLRLGFDGDFARTTLTFPRSSLQQRIGRLDDFIGRPLEGTRGIGGLLSPLLRELPRRLNAMSATTRERIAHNLLDLIATALVSISERPSLPPAMTLARVKLWIERHLGEELSAEDIAAGCGLSSRHLNRLFSREGTSLMQFVWERRLARCHRNLTDPAMRGRSITEIAFAAGFNDPSHFSRSYRAHYGCAPSVSRATCSAS